MPRFDVMVFPVIPWKYRFQRPQHLSTQLARRGYRVFYLSTEFLPAWCEYEVERVEGELYKVRLGGGEDPPHLYRDILTEAQRAAIECSIGKLRSDFRMGATLALVDYPFWRPLAGRIPNCCWVYHVMDDYASFPNTGPPVRELEPEMFAVADRVLCSSLYLQRKAANAGRESVLVRNGVDPDHFAGKQDRPAEGARTATIGYHGAIAAWTDIELLEYVAKSIPDARLLLVGAVENVDVSALAALPNVQFAGEVPYQSLPGYVRQYDVALLPYRACEYGFASDPMKVWEYLSAGKPVVALRYPEVERLAEWVSLASTPDEFVLAIRHELGSDSDAKREARQAFARENSWEHRCQELEQAVAGDFPSISIVMLCHDQLPFTQAALGSIERFTGYPRLELILVDNGSGDETRQFLKGWAEVHPGAHVVRLERNLGFAMGNNAGIRRAKGDYVILVNNDVFVTDGWLMAMLRHFRRDARLGLLGPVTNSTGNEAEVDIGAYGDMEQMARLAARHVKRNFGRRTPMHTVHFFCVMISRPVLETVGLLDENFGLGLFEDDDYCARARNAGYDVACAEDVYVHHHHSATFGLLSQDHYDALFARNREYYESKWGLWQAPGRRPDFGA